MRPIESIVERALRVRGTHTDPSDSTRPEPDVEIDQLEISRLHLHTRDGLDVRWRFDNPDMDGETHLEAERDCVADLAGWR